MATLAWSPVFYMCMFLKQVHAGHVIETLTLFICTYAILLASNRLDGLCIMFVECKHVSSIGEAQPTSITGRFCHE
jgi:hypothetical protein